MSDLKTFRVPNERFRRAASGCRGVIFSVSRQRETLQQQLGLPISHSPLRRRPTEGAKKRTHLEVPRSRQDSLHSAYQLQPRLPELNTFEMLHVRGTVPNVPNVTILPQQKCKAEGDATRRANISRCRSTHPGNIDIMDCQRVRLKNPFLLETTLKFSPVFRKHTLSWVKYSRWAKPESSIGFGRTCDFTIPRR
jgi:hypothetical protein